MINEQINQILSDLKCYIFKFNEITNTIEHNNNGVSSIHIYKELINIVNELNNNSIKCKIDKLQNIVINQSKT